MKSSSKQRSVMLLAIACMVVGAVTSCTGCTAPDPEPTPVVEEPAYAPSTRNRLSWKRALAFQQDLMRGLRLSEDEVCNELGNIPCVRDVHLVSLGGNEPFTKSQYNPLASPTVTTPIAVDRVALSACAARTDKDFRGEGLLYLPLSSATASVSEEQANAVTNNLVPALLGRNATDVDRTAIQALRSMDGVDVSPRDFATLACFTIATVTEILFQ
jgi:hypothetical protein